MATWEWGGSFAEGSELAASLVATFGEQGTEIVRAYLAGGRLDAAAAVAEAVDDANAAAESEALQALDLQAVMDAVDTKGMSKADAVAAKQAAAKAAMLEATKAPSADAADIIGPFLRALGRPECAGWVNRAAALCLVDGKPFDPDEKPCPFKWHEVVAGVRQVVQDQAIPR